MSGLGMGGLEGTLAGALFLLRFNWVWMLVALAVGGWVGWRTAGEVPPAPPAAPPEEQP